MVIFARFFIRHRNLWQQLQNLRDGFICSAAVTVIIWGTTFVSTKVLINNGLTPADIFFYRFLLAYVCIWFVSPCKLLSRSWRDELPVSRTGALGRVALLHCREHRTRAYVRLECLFDHLYHSHPDRFSLSAYLQRRAVAPSFDTADRYWLFWVWCWSCSTGALFCTSIRWAICSRFLPHSCGPVIVCCCGA